jgi:pantothenate synthetase
LKGLSAIANCKKNGCQNNLSVNVVVVQFTVKNNLAMSSRNEQQKKEQKRLSSTNTSTVKKNCNQQYFSCFRMGTKNVQDNPHFTEYFTIADEDTFVQYTKNKNKNIALYSGTCQ